MRSDIFHGEPTGRTDRQRRAALSGFGIRPRMRQRTAGDEAARSEDTVNTTRAKYSLDPLRPHPAVSGTPPTTSVPLPQPTLPPPPPPPARLPKVAHNSSGHDHRHSIPRQARPPQIKEPGSARDAGNSGGFEDADPRAAQRAKLAWPYLLTDEFHQWECRALLKK